MYKHILIPLDGSLLAEQALPQIPRVVSDGTKVTLLQVVRIPIPAVSSEFVAPMPDSGYDQALVEANAYLRSQANALAQEGIESNVDVVSGDDIAYSIVEYTNDHGVDLIIMSTHGRGGLSRLMFGSVAEGVIHNASCPVLVVRPS